MSSQIPGYQVIRKVGEGGMSTVYLAIQLSVGREVALKVLSPELRNDPTFAERFYREANIVGGLSHPNIISIYDVGKHGNHYYMAMDYLPGKSCKELIRSQKLSPLQAVNIVQNITDALEYIHDHDFLHCDIKPDNILFRADGSAVITDFGIAKEINNEKKQTVIAGTPHYMSPEQAQGQKLSKSSDIYSLGILLYEMLEFQLPYHAKDAIAIAIKHVSAPIPTLSDELKHFQLVINKMIAKRPGARFQNSNELRHALDFVQSQYLQQESNTLPIKLKLSFAADKCLEKIKSVAGLTKQLQFSFRYGLILKIVDDEFSIPDVNAIAKTIEKTMNTNVTTTLDTTSITNDSLALALQTDQAKKLVPAWIMNSLIILALGAVTYTLTQESLFDYMSHMGKPKIIYID